jgi:hypothetical protein
MLADRKIIAAVADDRQTSQTRRWQINITIGEHIMLYTIAVVLIILWLLGLVTSYTIGGFIHILLVIAVIMVLLRLISGRGL